MILWISEVNIYEFMILLFYSLVMKIKLVKGKQTLLRSEQIQFMCKQQAILANDSNPNISNFNPIIKSYV